MDGVELYIQEQGLKDPPVEGVIPKDTDGVVIKYPYVGFTVRSHIKPRFAICHIGQYNKGTQAQSEIQDLGRKFAEDKRCSTLLEKLGRLVTCIAIYQTWTVRDKHSMIKFGEWKALAKPSKASSDSSQTTARRYVEGPMTRSITRSGQGSQTSKRAHQATDEDPQRSAPSSSRGQALPRPLGRGEVQQEQGGSSRRGRKK